MTFDLSWITFAKEALSIAEIRVAAIVFVLFYALVCEQVAWDGILLFGGLEEQT